MDSIEIIRQLQNDPALKAEMRAVLLGEEILSLPELVRALADGMKRVEAQIAENSRQIEENSRQIAENSRQIEENSRQIAENSRQIVALTERLERVDQQIEKLVQVTREHSNRLQRLENQVGEIDGGQLEDDVRNYPRQYLRKMHITALRTVSDDERDKILDALSEDDQTELDRVDAVLSGKRRPDDRQSYVAVEASATAETRDLERALRRAQLLAKASRAPALPLVVTRRKPDSRIVNKARRMGIALSTKHDGLVLEAPWINGS